MRITCNEIEAGTQRLRFRWQSLRWEAYHPLSRRRTEPHGSRSVHRPGRRRLRRQLVEVLHPLEASRLALIAGDDDEVTVVDAGGLGQVNPVAQRQLVRLDQRLGRPVRAGGGGQTMNLNAAVGR